MKDPQGLLRHKALFDDFARQNPCPLSVYHFSSIFLWQDHFDFTFEVIDDHLCVWAKHSFGTFLYLPPLGKKLNARIVGQCFGRLRSTDSRPGVARIENVVEEELSVFDPALYKPVKKSHEYYYVREDLVELKGNAYKSKRSGYNQFVKNNRHECVAFDRRWTEDCLKLYDAWAQDRAQRSQDDIYKVMLEENRGVHALLFHYFDELGLEGRVVLVDQKPQAYTFGYPLNKDTFCVLVEVTNLDINGLSVYIFNKFCADNALKNFKFINAMDDFAMDNVAKTKESFRPAFLIPSYTVTEK